VINKCTLSQKIQKLYNDDSKELLMFYPSRIQSENAFNPNINLSGYKDDKNNSDKFIHVLK
jgi:hypothetical protein